MYIELTYDVYIYIASTCEEDEEDDDGNNSNKTNDTSFPLSTPFSLILLKQVSIIGNPDSTTTVNQPVSSPRGTKATIRALQKRRC